MITVTRLNHVPFAVKTWRESNEAAAHSAFTLYGF